MLSPQITLALRVCCSPFQPEIPYMMGEWRIVATQSAIAIIFHGGVRWVASSCRSQACLERVFQPVQPKKVWISGIYLECVGIHRAEGSLLLGITMKIPWMQSWVVAHRKGPSVRTSLH